jgi:hypothetical protein
VGKVSALATGGGGKAFREIQRKSSEVLKAAGYICSGLPDSQLFNLVAFCSSDIVLVQLAIGEWPDADKLRAIKSFPAPRNTRKLVHRWRSYARTPDVREVK